MDNLRKELQTWLEQGKFIGQESSTFYEQIICYENQCSQYLKPQVLLVEEKPERFLAAFLAILLNQGSVFLGNLHWQQQEWQQVATMINPDLIWGQVPQVFSALTKSHSSPFSDAYIFIPTGGTSGQIKFVAHTWQTLTASVQGFTICD
jgi:O-succinylbenzoic acid--CoA ligase